MKSDKFLKNVVIYFIGNVLTKMLSFFLIPLYTYNIKAEAYGYYDLTISIISLVVPIIFFQIWDGMFRFIYDYEKKEEKYKIITNGFFVSVIGTLILLILMVIINKIVKFNYLFLILGYSISFAGTYLYGTIARAFEENKTYMYSGIANTLITLILNILFITVLHAGIEGLYISYIVGAIVQIVIIERKVKALKNIKKSDISGNIIKKMIAFSLPIAISTISIWLFTGYAKVKISGVLGIEYNGMFAIATKFSSLIILVISVLQMAWQEFSYSLVKTVNKNSYYKKGIRVFFIIIMSSIMLIIPLTKIFAKYLLAENYLSILSILPLIYMYSGFSSFSGFLGTQFYAEKNSKTTLYSVIISAIINVVLVNLLINSFGLMGVSISLLISFVVNCIIRQIFLKIRYNVYIEFKLIFYLTLLLLVVFVVYYTLGTLFNALTFVIIAIISCFLLREQILVMIKKIIPKHT
ncbi:MAG: lipopolysaccharide biosynthesis protein [Clostridia bacterium]